jgi:hypothetical protein
MHAKTFKYVIESKTRQIMKRILQLVTKVNKESMKCYYVLTFNHSIYEIKWNSFSSISSLLVKFP